MTAAATAVRSRVRVEGVVQGVGFRPFVHALAERFGLTGMVGNDGRGVFVEVEGHRASVTAFIDALLTEAPPLAVVERVTTASIRPTGATGFAIVASPKDGEHTALVAADTATCDDCLAELFDRDDRRFRYPFVNCTNCGPRFTIVLDVPYDRPNTTMAGFAMCADCATECADPADRRFHAQPVCCPACGPALRLLDQAGNDVDGDAVAEAALRLRDGAVVAVKGLGGFHLAADAGSQPAVAALRGRKRREEKPFAVMVAGIEAAQSVCHVSDAEASALAAPARPVVLLARRDGDVGMAASVAPGNRSLGVMLPYTPLHHLLLDAFGGPLVMTSGNLSDEPIAYEDDDARSRLATIADCFLVHNRPIHIRTDDSVARVVRGREMVLRRSRGHAPRPVALPWALPRPVLACGAELKSTFCVAKGRRAFVSHHIGDLENYETLRSFTTGIEHFCRLFEVEPEVVAHDLHPEYLSTKHAFEMEGVELVGVQHHHAHVASCLADNGEVGPVVGLAFDGLGWGTDGTVWGGEVLVADLTGFERAGHLDVVAMPGGTAAIREPWRMAAAHLDACFGSDVSPDLAVLARNRPRWDDVIAVARAGLSSPLTSSCGRLFDAVAALIGVRDVVSYEGQAAIELEQLADPAETGSYPVAIGAGPPLRVAGSDLIRAVVDDLSAGTPPPVIAARFHNGLAAAAVAVAVQVAGAAGLDTVALSGGAFQNVLLLTGVTDGLEAAGLRILTHHQVPPNDGGISLGQTAVAGARALAGHI
jgi:hydrogenase maturation protein HypF